MKAFKYHRNAQAGRLLARLVAGYFLAEEEELSRFDHVIPAPWHAGIDGAQYDHMTLLVSMIRQGLGWPPDPNVLLVKVRATQSMAGKALAARLEAQEEVFDALAIAQAAPRLQGERVLVVDDLFTSGVTLNAAARRLKARGAEEVSGLCVLRSVHQPPD